MGSVSQTLLVFYSSFNFMLYPVLSKDFRIICKQYLVSKIKFFANIRNFCKRNASSNTLDTEVGLAQTNVNGSARSLTSRSTTSAPETQNHQCFDRATIFAEEFPTHAVEVSLMNEHATGNRVRSSLISVSPPASIHLAKLPLDDTSMIDPDALPLLLTENKNLPSAHCVTVNQQVCVIKSL